MEIIVFGDSVLKGVILENGKYKILKESFVNICEEKLKIKINNKAKLGSTILDGKKIIENNMEIIKETSNKYVILEFGGNDCDFNWKQISENPLDGTDPNVTISNFVKYYTEIIDEIKKIGKIPVLLSLPPIDSNSFFNTRVKGLNLDNILKWMESNKQCITNWHERYNIEVFKIAINNKVPIIDITSRFLEYKNYDMFLCDDGIHPNEK